MKKKKMFNFQLQENLKQRARKAASHKGTTISAYLSIALSEKLDRDEAIQRHAA